MGINYYIWECLPLGDMGENLVLRFQTEEQRDQVFEVWWAAYAAQKISGKPTSHQSKEVYGWPVDGNNLEYWLKRLS